MKLILGHGKQYECAEYEIRHNPVDVSVWMSDPNGYLSVDFDASVKPDIVYDLKHLPWTFAQDDSFDTIVDTTGIALFMTSYKTPEFLNELRRILSKGGTFYGSRNVRFVNE